MKDEPERLMIPAIVCWSLQEANPDSVHIAVEFMKRAENEPSWAWKHPAKDPKDAHRLQRKATLGTGGVVDWRHDLTRRWAK